MSLFQPREPSPAGEGPARAPARHPYLGAAVELLTMPGGPSPFAVETARKCLDGWLALHRPEPVIGECDSDEGAR